MIYLDIKQTDCDERIGESNGCVDGMAGECVHEEDGAYGLEGRQSEKIRIKPG